MNLKDVVNDESSGAVHIGNNTIISWDKSDCGDFTAYVVIKRHDDGSLEVMDCKHVRS